MTTASFPEDTMRLFFRTIAVSGLTLLVSSTLASAAEVRVLSVGSTQIAAKAIATEFEKQTGHKVTFTIRPPFDIDKELAEKTFDAVILSVPAMDNHDEAGDLVPMSRVALARVGVGVVVKEGGPVPDVSTPEKLKAAVLAARSLTHTDPAVPNTSGAIAAAAFAKLGILDEIKEKTRYATLAAGGTRRRVNEERASRALLELAREGPPAPATAQIAAATTSDQGRAHHPSLANCLFHS